MAESDSDELWLIADPSDLRKPHAQEMENLMQVRDLDGKLVQGYRTLNVLGVTQGRRGILYHRLFSSKAEDFTSEPWEVQQALKTVSQAMKPLKERRPVSWLVDRDWRRRCVADHLGATGTCSLSRSPYRAAGGVPAPGWAMEQ